VIALGIDLAGQPAGTAACLLASEGSRATAAALLVDLDDAALGSLRDRADVVAIDAPFGWPRAFTAALSGWVAERTWPAAKARDLRRRRWGCGLQASGPVPHP